MGKEKAMNWKDKVFERLTESRERTRAGNKIRARNAREKARKAEPESRWVPGVGGAPGHMEKFKDGKWVAMPSVIRKDPEENK